jgi:hypothetical protein
LYLSLGIRGGERFCWRNNDRNRRTTSLLQSLRTKVYASVFAALLRDKSLFAPSINLVRVITSAPCVRDLPWHNLGRIKINLEIAQPGEAEHAPPHVVSKVGEVYHK